MIQKWVSWIEKYINIYSKVTFFNFCIYLETLRGTVYILLYRALLIININLRFCILMVMVFMIQEMCISFSPLWVSVFHCKRRTTSFLPFGLNSCDTMTGQLLDWRNKAVLWWRMYTDLISLKLQSLNPAILSSWISHLVIILFPYVDYYYTG